ncbi:O-antigen ligase [Shewanella sp. Arc9-LZ]|uniref:O-antigen ligase family protein n=1 Tax=Shewanella sp. Arc9-LZ TaxID=2698686 RepID=UPI00137C2A78|nr:O-antigen ligase family protein [Shewanella sp. Arc9-LZ]QHS15150.1 O-antigen ligase family protein [Shewanella sp. Arc9-LZ]
MQLKTYTTFQLLFLATALILGTVLSNFFTTLLNISTLYDAKRFLVIAFVWFTVILACFAQSLKFYLPSKLSVILLIGFFVLAIASALQSKHPYWGMIELTNISLLFVIITLFRSSLHWLPKEKLASILFLTVALFSVFHFVVYVLNLSFYYFDLKSFHANSLIVGYDNIRFLNQLQVMLLPILFLPVFYSKLEMYKLYSLILVALHWLILFQTEARGAIISLVIAFSLILFYLPTIRRKLGAGFFLRSLLLGALLWLVFVIILPYLLFDNDSSPIRLTSSGRIDMWIYAMQKITEQPWFGFGPMSFAWAEGRPLANAHPHNSIVQLVYEYGAIVSLLVVGFLMKFFYKAFDIVKRENHGLTICLVFSITAIAIYSFFSGVIVMPFSQLVLAFVLAAFWALISERRLDHWELNTSLKFVLVLFVTFASIILLGSFEHEALQETGHPRFWLNGAVGF